MAALSRGCKRSKRRYLSNWAENCFDLTLLYAPPVGVAYDTYQKKLSSTTQKAGLHNGPPGFKFIKFPSVFKSLEFDDDVCLNKEGVEIVLNIEFQYRARPQKLKEIVMEFGNHTNYIEILK